MYCDALGHDDLDSWLLSTLVWGMVVGAVEDGVESGVIEEVTKGVNGSMRGRQEEDVGVCIKCGGGVGQSSNVSKARGIVDGVVEIPREGDK